jgi:hypothetical protein
MFELWQVVVDDVREEIRTYQVYLIRERHLAPSSLEIAVCALRFLYKVTLRPALVVRRPDPRTEEAAAAPHRAQSRRRRRARRSGAPTQEKSPRFHPVIRKPSRPRGTRRPHGQDRVQSESGTTTGRLIRLMWTSCSSNLNAASATFVNYRLRRTGSERTGDDLVWTATAGFAVLVPIRGASSYIARRVGRNPTFNQQIKRTGSDSPPVSAP